MAPTLRTMSQPLRWALGYSVTAPALLYLLHPCSRTPSADFCLITDKVTSIGAIGSYLFRSPEAIHSGAKAFVDQGLTGCLPFASSYRLITTRFLVVFFLQRTFTSLVHAHAGRTQGRAT